MYVRESVLCTCQNARDIRLIRPLINSSFASEECKIRAERSAVEYLSVASWDEPLRVPKCLIDGSSDLGPEIMRQPIVRAGSDGTAPHRSRHYLSFR